MGRFGEHTSAEDVRMDDVERCFASALSFLASTHDALRAAGKRMGRRSWLESFERIRSEDPLLNYLWGARNADVHDGLIAWQPGMFKTEYTIVDAAKHAAVTRGYRAFSDPIAETLRLESSIHGGLTGLALNEKIKSDPLPIPEFTEKAGIKVTVIQQSLILMPFPFRPRGGKVRENASA